MEKVRKGMYVTRGKEKPSGYRESGRIEGGDQKIRLLERAIPSPQMQQQAPAPAQTGADMGMPGGMEIPEQFRNRDKFEGFLFKKYGNPWSENQSVMVNQQLNKRLQADVPALFDHVFGGEYRYEDREYMDKKATDAWSQALLQYRANATKAITGDIEMNKKRHLEQMKAFDYSVKNYGQRAGRAPTVTETRGIESDRQKVYNWVAEQTTATNAVGDPVGEPFGKKLAPQGEAEANRRLATSGQMLVELPKGEKGEFGGYRIVSPKNIVEKLDTLKSETQVESYVRSLLMSGIPKQTVMKVFQKSKWKRPTTTIGYKGVDQREL